MEATTQEYIGTLEAERRYRISAVTIRKKVRAGLLTTYADPWDARRVLLKVSELEALLHGTPTQAPPKHATCCDLGGSTT